VPALALGILGTCCGGDHAVSSIAPTPAPAPASNLRRQLTITGVVRAVNGSPLADAAIDAWTNSRGITGHVSSTAADGSFRAEQFADDGLSARMNGYDSAWWAVPQSARPDDTLTITIKMQQTLRVAPGSTISSVITADDLTYRSEDEYPFWNGDYLCSPCKCISVPNTQTGATVQLSWSGGAPLTLWVGDAYQIPVQVSGQPGHGELAISVPANTPLNTIMVGLDRKRDPSPVLNGTITFTLAVEGPQ
jgi:hypothetical protein